MDDAATPNAPRRSRVSLLVLLVVLAFAIGIALMWSAVREGKGWWSEGAAPATQPSPAAATDAAVATPPAVLPNAAVTTTLAARESALGAQLAALEARTAAISVDVAGAADRAGQAEAILVAFAARRAIERGTALGYLEDQLRARFGTTQQRAVVTVIQAGRDPVTIEALRQALDSNASILLNPGPGDWFDGLLRELRTLVVLHEANTPSPLPSDRLARARRMLDAGQVEPALEEIGRLPGANRATNWTAAAQRYVEARRALDTLETAAIVGTIPSAQRPAPPAPAQPLADTDPLPLEQPTG